jgi:flagellar hook-associated protein 2
MSTIQFGGVVSGLNTQSIVDALVAAEKQPLTDLRTKETALTAQKTAYGQLGTAIDNVVTALKNFTVTSAGSSRAATSTNSSVLIATAGPSASVASYQVTVQNVATATRAVSTNALGTAITGTVDTSKTLATSGLATPITAGNMTVTVDGQAVSVAVDPATSTLQSVMTRISGAIQTQINATDAGTVSASIVNGQLQLSVTGNSSAHSISFGAQNGDPADSSNMATALGLDGPGVTNVQNTTINGTAYLDPTLSSLNLPGSVTAGQISAIVDGVIVHYTVGDPTAATLDQVMAGFGQAIQNQLQAGGNGGSAPADSAATATFSVVNNRLQVNISGAAHNHSLSFSASGDSSNALGMLGIANSSATNASNPTITGTTNLGVARITSTLGASGICSLTSTTSGQLKINGVVISYDTTKDTLSDVITRINNSGAGVVASIDRTNDKIQLTALSTGAVAIDVADVAGNGGSGGGNLAAALNLSPGTTTAQTIGKNALLTVDGRSIVSASNTVSTAIDGVALSLVGQSPIGETETVIVGADTTAVQSALSSFVSAFNLLGDKLDNLTASTPGTVGGSAGTSGPLANDPTAQTMFLSLRQTVMQAVGGGTTNSLSSLGVSTGAVGAAVGTTNRLVLNPAQLSTALTNDPNAAANLLDSATGPLGQLLSQLQGLEDPSNPQAYIQSNTASLADQVSSTQDQEAVQQEMVDNYTNMIEAEFTAMETTLATLQAQSAQIAAELGYTTSSTSSSSSGLSATTGS